MNCREDWIDFLQELVERTEVIPEFKATAKHLLKIAKGGKLAKAMKTYSTALEDASRFLTKQVPGVRASQLNTHHEVQAD